MKNPAARQELVSMPSPGGLEVNTPEDEVDRVRLVKDQGLGAVVGDAHHGLAFHLQAQARAGRCPR